MSSRLEMICPLRPLSQSLRLCQLPQRGSQGPDRSVLPLPLGEVSPQGTERARAVSWRGAPERFCTKSVQMDTCGPTRQYGTLKTGVSGKKKKKRYYWKPKSESEVTL